MTDVLRLFGPLVLWLASFSAVYGVQGLSCAQGWSNAPVVIAWGIAIVLQAALLALLYSARFGMRDGPGRWASLVLGVIGLIAVIWTLFPSVVLRACV
jgi:hypothetical protein